VTQFEQLTENFSALSFDRMSGGDLEGIDSLLPDVISEVKRLDSASQTASEDFDNLVQVKRERTAELAEVRQVLNEKYITGIRESVDNPASDISSISQGLIHLEREVAFRQDGLDFIEYVLAPTALDKKQETRRDLLRAQHLEAGLLASRSHCSMLVKLEAAGLSQTHGRVVAFSETTARLKLITAEAHRVAQAADADLSASRAARIARTQQRHADGQTTKAEAMFAAVELSRSNNTESSEK
jgi:hypothetical protein